MFLQSSTALACFLGTSFTVAVLVVAVEWQLIVLFSLSLHFFLLSLLLAPCFTFESRRCQRGLWQSVLCSLFIFVAFGCCFHVCCLCGLRTILSFTAGRSEWQAMLSGCLSAADVCLFSRTFAVYERKERQVSGVMQPVLLHITFVGFYSVVFLCVMFSSPCYYCLELFWDFLLIDTLTDQADHCQYMFHDDMLLQSSIFAFFFCGSARWRHGWQLTALSSSKPAFFLSILFLAPCFIFESRRRYQLVAFAFNIMWFHPAVSPRVVFSVSWC